MAVVDRGLDSDHADLADNVNETMNHNFTTGNFTSTRPHGTQVAGLIAARDNGLGVRGVAPRATIYGHNLMDLSSNPDTLKANMALAMRLNHVTTHVSNNSWSFINHNTDIADVPAGWAPAIETGLDEGAGGKASSMSLALETRPFSAVGRMLNIPTWMGRKITTA